MKRRGFILTEILTGMMLQVGFVIVLCGAFYMILNFSTSAQQGFAANDRGQMVITYFDSRIRNAGLGLWRCPSSKDVREALNQIPALKQATTDNRNDNRKLCLPVAVLNNDNTSGNPNTNGTLSHDRTGRFYSGNVLTLLYAHKDTHDGVRLILVTDKQQNSVTLQPASYPSMSNIASNDFSLIDAATQTPKNKSYTQSQFAESNTMTNIKSYAVMENAGIPVYTRRAGNDKVELRAFTLNQPTIYPMSEMLNLECQRLYTAKDANGYNFKFMELKDDGKWGYSYYHTKDILELYMLLDTRPNTADGIPIFELRVLVSEGLNEIGTTTAKPKDWPGRWTDDFSTHKVHVSKASWKLYNLAPFFTN